MRIVVFVGSPVDVAAKDLVKLAKKLKKEKVNVDLISLGEDSETTEKLSQFIETLNGKEGSGSHLVVVPPGPNLTDALRTSPVVQGEDGFTATGDFGSGFDVDPNLDPELALALRVSMEEQRQRQEEDNKQTGSEAMATDTPTTGTTSAPSNEDALLMNAINSMGGAPDYSSMTEDEQIALAIQMSMAESQTDLTSQPSDLSTEAESTATAMETEPSSTTESMEDIPDYSAVMSDPAFLQHLVGSLPGVDPNSEAIQNALQQLTGGDKNEGEKSDDKDKDKKEDK